MLFFLFVALYVDLDRAVVLGVPILLTVGIQGVRTLVVRTPTLASFTFSDFLSPPPLAIAESGVPLVDTKFPGLAEGEQE